MRVDLNDRKSLAAVSVNSDDERMSCLKHIADPIDLGKEKLDLAFLYHSDQERI